MADGQATMAIGSALLWSGTPSGTTPPPPPAPAEAVPGPAALVATGLADQLAKAPETIRRELRPAHGHSPLDFAPGRLRKVAFVDASLDRVHAAAHAHGFEATINDVVLSAVAGGLRRWLHDRHGATGPLRVQIPVSLHHADEEPGAVPNRDSFINVELPVQEEDSVRRLRAVAEQTRTRKAAHDAEELYALFADVAHVSKGLYRLAHRLAANPHVFALSISNVRGPGGELFLAGGRIREFYSLAEIAPHHALRVSADSFGDRMSIGLCADSEAVPNLDLLAEGIEDALGELTE
jgi:diacylglycerol O-acyltransferase